MRAKGVPPIEMTYTALARIAAGSGDGTRACELVRDEVAAHMLDRLLVAIAS